MKKILLDTSFILTSIRQKIDFCEELMGMEIIIPTQVIKEIIGLSKSKTEAEVALKLLKKEKFTEIDLGKGVVDKLIIQFAKKNPEIIVATLDKEIKENVKNKKLIFRKNKRFEIR